MTREAVVSSRLDVIISRRHADMPMRNVVGSSLVVIVEAKGPVKDNGHVIDPDRFAIILNDCVTSVFNQMLVLQWRDPLIETLYDKDTYNNAGWAAHVELMKERINSQGFYDTRSSAQNPFLEKVHILAMAEHPTGENIAYLIHRLISPALSGVGITQARVRVEENSSTSATFMDDVKPTPNHPKAS